jgi:hypothetical protein
MAPDEPFFPRLDRNKTYTMVQKDLERAGIMQTHAPFRTAMTLSAASISKDTF